MVGTEVYEKIKEAEKELDRFNLELAKWRMQYGMSQELIAVYRAMGNLSSALINTKRIADLSGLVARLEKDENLSF